MLRLHKTVSYTCYVNDFDTADRAWVPEIWAQETLAILEENMVIGQLVHTDFEDEFKSFGDTVNTRKPGEFTAKRKGVNDDVTVQNATAVKVAVVLNQHVHTSFVIKDGEESKSFADLIKEYLAPAAKSLAEHIDRVLLGQVVQFRENQVALDPVSPSDDIKDLILDLREEMNINKVPVPGRQLILTTKTETEALKLDLFISADKIGDEGTAMREASLGRKLGFDTYMCQNTPAILSGTYTDGTTNSTGSVDNGSGYPVGTTVFVMSTDSSAILPGMYIQWTDACGGFYRVTASGATAMTLDQGILQAVADDQFVRYYTQGAIDIDGDAATSTYPAGYSKPLNIAASGVVPQVGQFVGFTSSGNVLYSGEYTIIEVDDGSGTGDYYITLDRPLDVALASSNGDKVCYGPIGQYSFGFDRNAMALVVRPLALPMEGTAKAGVASFNDLSLRVTITYEGRGQGHLVTLDLLCGVKVLDVDRGAMLTR